MPACLAASDATAFEYVAAGRDSPDTQVPKDETTLWQIGVYRWSDLSSGFELLILDPAQLQIHIILPCRRVVGTQPDLGRAVLGCDIAQANIHGDGVRVHQVVTLDIFMDSLSFFRVANQGVRADIREVGSRTKDVGQNRGGSLVGVDFWVHVLCRRSVLRLGLWTGGLTLLKRRHLGHIALSDALAV